MIRTKSEKRYYNFRCVFAITRRESDSKYLGINNVKDWPVNLNFIKAAILQISKNMTLKNYCKK